MSLGGPLDWQRDGVCAESPVDYWFSERGDNKSPVLAKGYCARCLVKAECLSFALDLDIDHGVWGGTTPAERVTLRRRSRIAA